MVESGARMMVLLGAGASADAGLPLTSELAAQVVAAANADTRPDGPFPAIPDWVRAINAVYSGMVGYQGARGSNPLNAVNIETLISAVRLIRARDSHEVAPFVASWSPALSNFDSGEIPSDPGDKIASAISKGLASGYGFAGHEIAEAVATIARAAVKPDLEEPFAKAEIFILSTLVQLLGSPTDVSYLQPLVDVAREQAGGLDVITLNYDLTVEATAAANNLPLNRGVESWVPGTPLSFPATDGVLNLMKLHGSLDWRRSFGRDHLPSFLAPRGIEVVAPLAIAERAGEEGLPWIVVGDREKLATDGPTLLLNYAARDALTRAKHLAIVGYSFSDVHINAMIRDWLAADVTRTISVLDYKWPRERYSRPIQDFRSALVAVYARDRDSGRRPVVPRMVALEGKTRDSLTNVLLARPQLASQQAELVRVASSGSAVEISVKLLGWDLTNVSVSGRPAGQPDLHPSRPGGVILHKVPPETAGEEDRSFGLFGSLQYDVWTTGEVVRLYVMPDVTVPFDILVEGASIVGGRHFTLTVENVEL